MSSLSTLLLLMIALPIGVHCKGTKYGCLDGPKGTVNIQNLCPNDGRAQILTASYGSWKQTFRHVCSRYPAEPKSGWPICSSNSVDVITNKFVELCNYRDSCSFDAHQVFPPSTLNCNTGDFMYFQVQFECFSPKSVCASFISKDSLAFSGVQKGQTTFHNCPDYWLRENRAQEKCLGSDIFDSGRSVSCPNTLINEGVFLLTQSSVPAASKLDESWSKLTAAFINESSVLPTLQNVASIIQTSLVKVDYQRLKIIVTVARVAFISSRAGDRSTYMPLSELPRFTFTPGVINKAKDCRSEALTAVVGTVDFSYFTQSFKVENLNSDIIFATLQGANCVLTEETLNQPIELDILLSKDTIDGYMPECITWGNSMSSSYKEPTEDAPNVCSTVEINKSVTKCKCRNTGGFYAVRTVPRPTTTTIVVETTTTEAQDNSTKSGNASARVVSSESLATSSSFVSVNEIDDDEHSNETGLGLPNTTFVNRIFDNESFSNGTTDDVLDSEELVPLDLEQILFICACLIHAAILYLIPSFAICKCVHWIARLLLIKCQMKLFKSSPEPQLGGTQGSNGDNNKDCIRLVTSNGVVPTTSSTHSVNRSKKCRLLLTFYSPLAAFCVATSLLILSLCSFAQWQHITSMSVVQYGIAVEAFLIALAAFLLFEGAILEFIHPNHSIILALIPIVPAACFSYGAHSVSELSAEVCWPLLTTTAIALFSILPIIFLVGLVLLPVMAYRGTENTKMTKVGLFLTWMCAFGSVLLSPIGLFLLTLNWSMAANTVFFVACLNYSIAIFGLFLRISFTGFYKYSTAADPTIRESVLTPSPINKEHNSSPEIVVHPEILPDDFPIKSIQSHDFNANETET